MADYGTRNSTKKACRMVFCTLQGNGRGVDPALDEADKLHGASERLGKLHLRQPPILAQVGDPLAESLLKHGG